MNRGPVLRSAGVIVAVYALAGAGRACCFDIYRVQGQSMEPTLNVGDLILANKLVNSRMLLGHAWALFDRGDIGVFRLAGFDGTLLVKRVIGLPGDTLLLRGGELYVNSELAGDCMQRAFRSHAEPPRYWHQRYLIQTDKSRYRPSSSSWGPIQVPSGSYFVLSDSPETGGDSRKYGFLEGGEVVARLVLRFRGLRVGGLSCT